MQTELSISEASNKSLVAIELDEVRLLEHVTIGPPERKRKESERLGVQLAYLFDEGPEGFRAEGDT